jgi:hypothetical protein
MTRFATGHNLDASNGQITCGYERHTFKSRVGMCQREATNQYDCEQRQRGDEVGEFGLHEREPNRGC